MAKVTKKSTEQAPEQGSSAPPKVAGNPVGRVLALVLTGVFAVMVVWTYARASNDGMDQHWTSQMALIAPDFEELSFDKAKQVPDFTLTDRYGNKVRLSQFADVDLLLVNIWSSGCRVCLEEVPSLTELDRRIGKLGKAALITIAVDEKWSDVAHHFPQGTDLRVLFDPEDEVARGIFGTKAYPETFVLDRKRRIRAMASC